MLKKILDAASQRTVVPHNFPSAHLANSFFSNQRPPKNLSLEKLNAEHGVEDAGVLGLSPVFK